MTEFMIGCDPELFVRDTAGVLVSAHDMIPGTKNAPFRVDGGAVQVDGMALEFNTNPAKTFEEFNNNITSVLAKLQTMIPEGYTFEFSPVAAFGKEYIDAQPEEAKMLGCDPDYNAYTGLVNPKPDANMGIRTASGHIHIGWTSDQDVTDPDHIEACQMVVKQLDVTLGLMCRIWDKDTTRRQMYGNFGAYRVKPYGVEYRTPSNVWVADEVLRRLVFNTAMGATRALLEGKRIYEQFDINEVNHGYMSNGDLFYYIRQYAKKYGVLNELDLAAFANVYDKSTVNVFKTSKNGLRAGEIYNTIAGVSLGQVIIEQAAQPAHPWNVPQPMFAIAAEEMEIEEDFDEDEVIFDEEDEDEQVAF